MKKDLIKTGVDRRQFLRGTAAGAATVLAAPYVKTAAAADRKIVVRDAGGPFSAGFGAAFYAPFEKETGIKVVAVQASHEPTGMVKAMVETGNYTWDVTALSKSSHQALANGNYLAPIAPKGGPGKLLNEIPEDFRTEFIMGTDAYATLIAYREDQVKKAPKNWADFYDTKGVAGLRSLRKHPYDTLEEALLADGVKPEDLYPLDIDRAFRKLDEIKEEIAIWWTGGAQTSQILKTGEVDMLPAWNGRAQVAIDDGAPVKLVWDQALYTYEGWSILRGTPKLDLCREFIEFCADGENQARFTPHVAYGPTNPNAYKYVDPERAKVLPTNPEYLVNMVPVDTDFWGKHKDEVVERFNGWLLS